MRHGAPARVASAHPSGWPVKQRPCVIPAGTLRADSMGMRGRAFQAVRLDLRAAKIRSTAEVVPLPAASRAEYEARPCRAPAVAARWLSLESSEMNTAYAADRTRYASATLRRYPRRCPAGDHADRAAARFLPVPQQIEIPCRSGPSAFSCARCTCTGAASRVSSRFIGAKSAGVFPHSQQVSRPLVLDTLRSQPNRKLEQDLWTSGKLRPDLGQEALR
jgi:hypothetical protein